MGRTLEVTNTSHRVLNQVGSEILAFDIMVHYCRKQRSSSSVIIL